MDASLLLSVGASNAKLIKTSVIYMYNVILYSFLSIILEDIDW